MANTTHPSPAVIFREMHEDAVIAAKSDALKVGALQEYAKARGRLDKKPKCQKKYSYRVMLKRNDGRYTKQITVRARTRLDAWLEASDDGWHHVRDKYGSPDLNTVERDKRRTRKTSVEQQCKTRPIGNQWLNIFGPHPVWYRGWELICGRIEFELLSAMYRTLAAAADTLADLRQPVCV